MSINVGGSASEVVVALVYQHADVQYLRLRPYVLSSTNAHQERSEMPIGRALRHIRAPEHLWEVPNRLTVEDFEAALRQLAGRDRVVGFCSQIERTLGRYGHALLMDFHCQKSVEALDSIEAACRHLGYAGWILETEHSYHFVGNRFVDRSEWTRFITDFRRA